jgi:hypothetical protein
MSPTSHCTTNGRPEYVRVIVPPRPTHASGIDLIRHDLSLFVNSTSDRAHCLGGILIPFDNKRLTSDNRASVTWLIRYAIARLLASADLEGPEKIMLKAAMKNPWNLPKRQILIQETERGCSVPVFAQLAGISIGDLKRELPGAILGQVTVNEWITWLEGKGFAVLKGSLHQTSKIVR